MREGTICDIQGHITKSTATERSASVQKNQALELSWGHESPVFLSWTPSRTSSSQDSYQVELCRHLGEKLGLKDGEQVQRHSEQFVFL